ncbi:hypothetical protein [Paenibacillus chitinolyticus]|uniref:hypothetical protein n=1 Tax=Paenibacillus chitinolyticus TaxID=79263 RepID=UPI001C484A89|nr:hypothetical protein [Paenibacillus chitinolyticus]MBV6717236.1 hypothetical protein [Paenibacillus chitinolyticus]
MGVYKDTGYYKSVDGRITTLYKRVPNYRPLSEEALSEIDSMTIERRERLDFEVDALIGLMQAQIDELKSMKERATKRPPFKVLR